MTMLDGTTVPKHDPDTCQRQPCRRCQPPGVSAAPKVRDNPHDAAPSPRSSLPKDLDPISLAQTFEAAAKALRATGVVTWQRLHDWRPTPHIPTYPGPDDDGEQKQRPPRSAAEEQDRLENAQASRYWTELSTTAPRARADAQRITRLCDIANHPNRKGSVSNTQGCELCTLAGLKQNGAAVPFDHRSNVGERLERDMFLCQPHYLYVQRHDHPPTTEQTRHWSTTGTWKVKTG